MKFAKLIYKASVDGSISVEQQISEAEIESRLGRSLDTSKQFEKSLRYDITRTVCNILSNATIKYSGLNNTLTDSLQKNLINIFFCLHDYGYCYLIIDETSRIIDVNNNKGTIKLIDKAYEITKITQKEAAHKSLEMYGVVTDTMYSVLDERGMLGVFSPAKGTEVKPSQALKLYNAFKSIFGVKKGQRKFAITEVPMTYSGVNIPVADLKLIENKKEAVSSIARIYGIAEDMIQGGATFDNKENAIIQTYSDYKGLIYSWINQIEQQLISFRKAENYEVTFSGIPQLQQSNN